MKELRIHIFEPRKLTDEEIKKLTDPIENAKVAKLLYDQQVPRNPWYGTKYLAEKKHDRG